LIVGEAKAFARFDELVQFGNALRIRIDLRPNGGGDEVGFG